MHVNTYLVFEGRCEEALAFYAKALGATTTLLMRFADNPEPNGSDAANADKVMHAEFKVGDTMIYASDGRCVGDEGGARMGGFGLTIECDDDAQARRFHAALAEGGSIAQPLEETFFATSFGMSIDRFGVCWMVMVPKPVPQA